MLRRLAALLGLAVPSVLGCSALHGHCGDSTLVPGATDMFMSWQSDVEGTASVGSGGASWQGAFGGHDAAIDAAPAAATSCSVDYLVGRFTDAGKGTLWLWVGCAVGGDRVTFELAIPDARPLASGTVKAIAGGIVVTHGKANCLFVPHAGASLATLTVDSAVGTGAPSPAFVTADFSRKLHLELHAAAAQLEADADAGSTTCVLPDTASLEAVMTLTPDSYRQAEDVDYSGCSNGGAPPAWLPKIPVPL